MSETKTHVINFMDKPSVITESPDILGGIPVFVGTRVPVRTMFDYFIRGHALAEFLDDFPTVTSEQVASALEECREQLLKGAHEAVA